MTNVYELQKEEYEHKLMMARNREVRLEAEIDEANEKVRSEEAKFRQIKMEYDELKFQFSRRKILDDDSPKYTNYRTIRAVEAHPNQSYENNNQFEDRYTPKKQTQPAAIKPQDRANHFVIKNDAIADYNEIISDKLYQKNMKSSIGELLRWDSTAGKGANDYKNYKTNPRSYDNRSISNPPTRNNDYIYNTHFS